MKNEKPSAQSNNFPTGPQLFNEKNERGEKKKTRSMKCK